MMKREEDVEQVEKPARKQSGAAIFDALYAFEGPIERDQPTMQQEREALIDTFPDSLASDHGRDTAHRLLDERDADLKRRQGV
jgi:hypothetical protein